MSVPIADEISDDGRLNAMRRKAGAGRLAPQFGRVTPASVLRSALAHSAESSLDLVLAVGAVDETLTALSVFCPNVPENALLALIEGPSGATGIAVLETQTLSALIEVQTTGQVLPGPATPRPPTRTDGVMAADFIDRFLEELERQATEADLAVAPSLTGFRYAHRLADDRAIQMSLADIAYRQFNLSVDLGSGAKSGQIVLLFPRVQAGKTPAAKRQDWQQALRRAVENASVSLTAILTRVDIPLDTVTGFKQGSLIPLPRETLRNIQLEDLDGHQVGAGRLGQTGGNRAVCVVANRAMAGTAVKTTDQMAARLPLAAGDDSPSEVTEILPQTDLREGSDL